MMNKSFLTMIVAAGALAVPAGALADHGKPADPGSQSQGHGQSHRCAKVHTVGFQVHGTFVSFDGTTLTLSNAKGNKHARSLITNGSIALALGSATVNFSGVQDANNDSSVGWDDVTTADNVVVHGRAVQTKHGCPAGDSTAPTIQRVKVVVPDQSDSQDSQSND
jgi:hypothetical protein